MQKTTREIVTLEETGEVMAQLTLRFAADIGRAKYLKLAEWFRIVADLPYIPDPEGEEAVSRPKWSLRDDAPFRDCDDKAILIGSWAYLNGISFRYLAVSFAPSDEVYHAVTELWTVDGSIIIDPTYPENTFPNVGPYFNNYPITEWL